MAYPFRNHQELTPASTSMQAMANSSNGNSLPTVLLHNPGLSTEWNADEQGILEKGLSEFASDSIINRYANIAARLQHKTVRDVALRCRWMTKKENSKRKKEEHSLKRKGKDVKKEKATDISAKSSHLRVQPDSLSHELPKMYMYEEIFHKAIGGPRGELLKQNELMLSQIHANLSNFQIQENVNLFCKIRDNILSLQNEDENMPGIMKQMPPIPFKLDEKLVNTALSSMSVPMQHS